MLKHELDQAIEAIEAHAADGKRKTIPKMSQHRWAQILRILKFYRLRWNEFDDDPVWDGPQDHPESPYFIKGEQR